MRVRVRNENSIAENLFVAFRYLFFVDAKGTDVYNVRPLSG
jgi:hypothetical protein